jgi:hypothetical protein
VQLTPEEEFLEIRKSVRITVEGRVIRERIQADSHLPSWRMKSTKRLSIPVTSSERRHWIEPASDCAHSIARRSVPPDGTRPSTK